MKIGECQIRRYKNKREKYRIIFFYLHVEHPTREKNSLGISKTLVRIMTCPDGYPYGSKVDYSFCGKREVPLGIVASKHENRFILPIRFHYAVNFVEKILIETLNRDNIYHLM